MTSSNETSAPLNLRRPDMENASDEVEPFLRRTPAKDERRGDRRESNTFMWVVVSVLALAFAAALLVSVMYIDHDPTLNPPKAHAEMIRTNLTPMEAACAYNTLHPGRIISATKLHCV